ncbi:MAG: response regulator transcription factor [Acidobacteriota bacterium]
MKTNASATWSIVVADDHPVVRIGVRNILGQGSEFRIVGEAGDGSDAVRMVRALEPDLLLLDLAMPTLPGLEALKALAEEVATLKTVILTGTIDQRQILEALQSGARGIVLKDAVADHLVEALRVVVDGRYWLGGQPVTNLVQAIKNLMADASAPSRSFNLTPREFQVVGAIVEGCSNRDIARQFEISEETVKRHLTNIFDKTGVSNRLELAMFAVHHRLLFSN